MKFSWMVICLAMAAGVAVSGVALVGCGPETKFCLPNGPCPLPITPPTDGGGGGMDTGSDQRPADTGVDRPRDRRN